VPRMLPTQKAIRVMALAVTFFEWPAMLEAFQARRSMKAAPNVPVRKEPARRPALLLGCPFGSRPMRRAAPKIVGRTATSMIKDRSCHLSDRYPISSTHTAPMAPLGVARMRACCDVYPT